MSSVGDVEMKKEQIEQMSTADDEDEDSEAGDVTGYKHILSILTTKQVICSWLSSSLSSSSSYHLYLL